MSTQNEKKIQGKVYAPASLFEDAKGIATNLDLSASKLMEIAIYHIVHCSPTERAAIIAKYFDPNWPPKDET
jgi:hypothetical protein